MVIQTISFLVSFLVRYFVT